MIWKQQFVFAKSEKFHLLQRFLLQKSFKWTKNLQRLLKTYDLSYIYMYCQRRNQGARKAESLWGRRITAGDPEWLRGAPKNPTKCICFRKTLRSNMGRQICFLPWAPSNLVTPLYIVTIVWCMFIVIMLASFPKM